MQKLTRDEVAKCSEWVQAILKLGVYGEGVRVELQDRQQ